jgi:hypothetical protein
MPASYNMRVKPITKTKQTPEVSQIRDTFETPKYAVDLLLPFIPKEIEYIWEPACGSGKISRVLEQAGCVLCSSDIREKETPNQPNEIFFLHNFLTDEKVPPVINDWFDESKNLAIITNPPFSIKDKFIEKAFSYGIQFAFLINADYSGMQINWIERGCEKIIPKRRVNYITPNILSRIHEGEVWNILKDKRDCANLKEYKLKFMNIWITDLWVNHDFQNFQSVDDVPSELLYKYSSSQFHSIWLTHGFGLGKSETFVDVPIKYMKGNMT